MKSINDNTGMDMATRSRSAPKTSAELREQLEQARKKLAQLEQRAYAEELFELISKTNIVADFNSIKSRVQDIRPDAILKAIGHAVGMRRLTVKQDVPEPRKRSATDTAKPKRARKKAVPTAE
jgi:alanyl-tRNA synthetase